MLKQYYRLAKPGIIRGNLWNTAGGFLLASSKHLDPGLFIATLAGTGMVIASGCVFNNYIDREIDAKMARTKKRALVTGEVSNTNALIFATVLSISGFLVLGLFTNILTLAIGLIALILYVVVYGYFKRRSTIGTLVGSIPGSLPPVAGYTAVTGHIDIGAWLIFIILACWQMAHFYAIAMYRHNDYKNAGLPVLPVVKGAGRAKISIMGYILAFILACSLMTYFNYTGYIFLTVMACLGIMWLIIGFRNYNEKDSVKWGKTMFFYSLTVILALAIMMAVGGRLV
ncbi:MAG: heme o synthase [Candidatus Saccharimonadales bacterium]